MLAHIVCCGTHKGFTCGVHKKNEHHLVMKGYYENFCYEVYIVVIFLIEDSVMQKSILTYDEMVLNFFITPLQTLSVKVAS